ncbi:GNAT family N-acetyltransferase [Lysinibacillus fusiformis]|uniref:GNAT family N-acetyltransferase n=1 Tax=Lysinibacillus fusiformis TaxID=28031 RepID=UPI0020BF4023|nr:GNAT family N-acetyltransferase [Lysinibacillus fusiformis]
MTIIEIQQLPQQNVLHFFKEHWGTTEMVISSGVYDCSQLGGFAFVNDRQEMIGLVTYIIRRQDCEIISLDSLEEGKGIGSALVQAVEQIALDNGCTSITLITTNDNLHALKFYQKRGYYFIEILPNAVEKARAYKPSIPLIGNDGIAIRDELRLQKQLDF